MLSLRGPDGNDASPGRFMAANRERIRLIVDFWTQLAVCEDSGATTWEVLEDLERKVTDCLDRTPPQLGRAESLTAEAICRMTGQREF